MAKYAEQTKVPVESSKAEIERILSRYGASKFMQGWDSDKAVIGFVCRNLAIRMELPLPELKDFRWTEARRVQRSDGAMEQARNQELRRRWRALALTIKAKLEAVESGISTFEREFLSYVVVPGGGTIGDWLLPKLTDIASGNEPLMLPPAREPEADLKLIEGVVEEKAG